LKTKIIFLLIIILTAVLRICDIETKNMWFDEVYSWKLSQKSVTDIIADTSGDIHPPLFYIVLKYWIVLFSDSVFSMRLLSALLGVLSLIFIFKISRLIFKADKPVMFVLLLYAVSPVNIFYSQEIRMLNLNLFLTLGSVYFFLFSMKDNSVNYLILFVLFLFAAIYTHYFSLLILFTIFVVLILKIISKQNTFSELRGKFTAVIIVNALYIPWYPVFFSQISKGQPWRTVNSIQDTGHNFLNYFKDNFLSVYYGFEPIHIQYLSLFISFFLLAYLLYCMFRFLNSEVIISADYNYIILFFYLPLLIALIISFKHYIILSRYLSIIIPYLIITVIFFSTTLFKNKIQTLLFLFLFCVSSAGVYINYSNSFKNNDYRKVISFIEENYYNKSIIINEPHFMGWSIEYHSKHSETKLPVPEIFGWDLKMQLDSLKNRKDIDKFWLILDYSSLANEDYVSAEKVLNQMGFKKSLEKTFYVIPAKVSAGYYVRQNDPEFKN